MADFKQYYNVDLPIADDTEEIEDIERMAILLSQLPKDSRLLKSEQPSLEWSESDYLLWLIEYNTRLYLYSMMDKKAKAGQPKPKPLQTPSERKQNRQQAENAERNRAEINRILGLEDDNG